MATASPGSFSDELERARARVERCPTTRKNLKKTLARAAESHLAEPDRPEVPKWGVGGLATIIGVGFLLMLIVACAGCVPVEAVKQAETEAAIGHGVAMITSLPIETRQYGARQFKAWSALHRSLTGEDVPGADAWPLLPVEVLPPVPTTEAGR